MNQPYVKRYNADGSIANPIHVIYSPSRPEQTRDKRKNVKHRFFNNRNSYPLVVYKDSKYKKVLQLVMDKETGRLNKIEHYLLKN